VIHRKFKRAADLSSENAATLLLKPSQPHTACRILSGRLAVVWGLPGMNQCASTAPSDLLWDPQARDGCIRSPRPL
jgi:hypothetical protein